MLVSMVHGDGARRHGAFDPEKARIDVDPLENKQHTPHVTG